MTSMECMKTVLQFYYRRDARLRRRLQRAESLAEALLLLRSLQCNRRSILDLLIKIDFLQKSLDIGGKSSTIKLPDTEEDGGPGSGNHGHKGVPGQVGGSAPNGAAAEATRFVTKDGIMKVTSDLKIKASKTGKTTVMIKEGSEIGGIYSFAGKGSDKNLVVSGFLSKQYGGKPDEWGHLCGFATVVTGDGTEQRREIHWFEHKDVGQIKFKVKKREDSS